MNIEWFDKFVTLEKRCLDLERERLNSARSVLKSPKKQVQYQHEVENSNNSNQKPNKYKVKPIEVDKPMYNDPSAASLLTEKQQQQREENGTYAFYTEYGTDNELNEAAIVPALDLQFQENEEQDSAFYDEVTCLPKKTKDLVNQRKTHELTAKRKEKKKEDEMEQWVSDTFYSYFPSFNNENQKRQNYLRERQQENQQNFLKHQQKEMLTTTKAQKQQNASRTSLTTQQQQQQNLNTTRSSSTSTTDKTDLEIIVNNPNYVPPKQHSTRGGSTSRHKLLQDLRHTDLLGDGVFERNRRNAELISERKQDYQRELMLQIEEKRHTIERLRERERLQDEALTKRLEDQLRTIKLEEQLEKEKMRQDRLLFDSAQNRLLRDHLLAKLENDTKRLYKKQKAHILEPEILAKDERNKVYKYFSNSARHEYRRGQPLPAEVEIDVEIPERLCEVQQPTTILAEGERECYHLTERVCPVCDAPLRSFKSSCLRCQRKLSMKMKVSRKADAQKQKSTTSQVDIKGNGNNNEQASVNEPTAEHKQQINDKNVENSKKSEVPVVEESIDMDAEDVVVEEVRNVSLVCTNCEVVYAMCKDCLCKSDVCRACRRKRNVCLNCRRNLCSFCLQEIASGRDTERTHINENDCQSNQAFQVLDVSYQTPEESDSYEVSQPKSNVTIEAESSKESEKETDRSYGPNLVDNHILNNKLPQEKEKNGSNEQLNMHASYSLNISKNSIFHEDYKPKPNNLHEEQPAVAEGLNLLPNLANDEVQSNEILRLERTHKETERRLSRYLKNYGDLMQRRAKSESRGTQTTPESAGRRDVVLREENNLSMPLLREMPKMTRQQTKSQPQMAHNSNIENLKRRWEIPAVQKFTISTKSPRVLTQIGAIRQQLQASSFFEDEINKQ